MRERGARVVSIYQLDDILFLQPAKHGPQLPYTKAVFSTGFINRN